MFRIMFCAAFENDVAQQDKQTQVKRSAHRECRSNTTPCGAAARFDDKLEANLRNAGQGLLQHIVNRGDGVARFFHSVVVDVVNIGNGKCQLESDADADEYQTDECHIRLLEMES